MGLQICRFKKYFVILYFFSSNSIFLTSFVFFYLKNHSIEDIFKLYIFKKPGFSLIFSLLSLVLALLLLFFPFEKYTKNCLCDFLPSFILFISFFFYFSLFRAGVHSDKKESFFIRFFSKNSVFFAIIFLFVSLVHIFKPDLFLF